MTTNLKKWVTRILLTALGISIALAAPDTSTTNATLDVILPMGERAIVEWTRDDFTVEKLELTEKEYAKLGEVGSPEPKGRNSPQDTWFAYKQIVYDTLDGNPTDGSVIIYDDYIKIYAAKDKVFRVNKTDYTGMLPDITLIEPKTDKTLGDIEILNGQVKITPKPSSFFFKKTYAAITHDVSGSNQANNATSVTIAVTVTASLSKAMAVGMPAWRAATFSSATYDGSTMTAAVSSATDSNNCASAIYYLALGDSPSSGSRNFVFNTSASDWINGAGTVIAGVAQTSSVGQTNSSTGPADSFPSLSVTTATDGEAIFDSLSTPNDSAFTMTAQTNRTQIYSVTFDGDASAASRLITKTTAGAQTMNWSAASYSWALSVASFKADTGGGGGGAPAERRIIHIQ